MNNETTKPYEAPSITAIGDVEAITAGNPIDGNRSDRTFPAGTPFGELTWYTSP